MQISPGSSEGSAPVRPRLSAVAELVGRSPLVTLQRSGEGRAHVKVEGMNPGGSFFDRVARVQLEAVEGRDIVCVGATAWTVSVVQQAAARGLRVEVVLDDASPRRVIELVRRFGARVTIASGAGTAHDHARARARDRVVHLTRRDPRAHLTALRVVRAEVDAQLGRTPERWVCVDFGADRAAAARALGAPVSWIRDDGEHERRLIGTAAARRTQMGHREGLLVSPVGAEVTDRTVHLALGLDGDVVGVVPEGGHRYLGWW